MYSKLFGQSIQLINSKAVASICPFLAHKDQVTLRISLCCQNSPCFASGHPGAGHYVHFLHGPTKARVQGGGGGEWDYSDAARAHVKGTQISRICCFDSHENDGSQSKVTHSTETKTSSVGNNLFFLVCGQSHSWKWDQKEHIQLNFQRHHLRIWRETFCFNFQDPFTLTGVSYGIESKRAGKF